MNQVQTFFILIFLSTLLVDCLGQSNNDFSPYEPIKVQDYFTKVSSSKCDPAHPTCSFSCLMKKNMKLSQKCELSRHDCGEIEEDYNFLVVNFCWFHSYLWIYIPLAFLLIYIIFTFVSATVEDYIASGLTMISETLKLSEAFAAVTLIALANGAGDVITAIVASGGEGGVNYNIGSLYGAGFFVCSIVMCLTIFRSTIQIVVEPGTIYRDIGLYILATIIVIIFAIIGEIYWWSALIFLVLYVVLVLIVVWQDKKKSQEQPALEDDTQGLRKSEGKLRLSAGIKKLQKITKKILIQQKVARAFKYYSRKTRRKLYRQYTFIDTKKKGDNQTDEALLMDHKFINNAAPNLQTVVSQSDQENQDQIKEKKEENEEDEEEELEWKDMNAIQRILCVIQFPFLWLRKLTMPPCDQDSYDKNLCIVWPVFGIPFIIWAVGLYKYIQFEYLMIGAESLIAILIIILYYTQKDLKEKEVPSYFFGICIAGLLLGLLWTYVASDILIDLLNSFTVLLKLDKTFMGLAILGIGNALPDALTTIALAKKGYAQMGITGGYAGQLFGLLIGFGIAQLKTTLVNKHPSSFDLFGKNDLSEDLLDIWAIFICLTMLVITSVYGIINKFVYDKKLAYMQGILYGIFIVGAIGMQINLILQ